MAKGALYISGAIVALILIRDGTAGAVIQNSAGVLKSLATGVKPLSTVA
jgi:hypothetical protein